MNGPEWNYTDEQYLLDNYDKIPITKISERLKRSPEALSRRITRIKENGAIPAPPTKFVLRPEPVATNTAPSGKFTSYTQELVEGYLKVRLADYLKRDEFIEHIERLWGEGCLSNP